MGVGQLLLIAVALSFIVFVLWTMPFGQRLAGRLGVQGFGKTQPPHEDRTFLLQACGNDPDRVARLLSGIREEHPDLTEAELYRRAIRQAMRDKHGGKVA